MSRTTADGDETPARIAPDEQFRVLAAEPRRVVLDVLDGDGPVDLLDLAGAVGDARNGDAADDRVALSLHHHHLPLMDEVGVLEYDPERRTVSNYRTAVDRLSA